MSELCFSLTSPLRRPDLTTFDRSVSEADLDAVRQIVNRRRRPPRRRRDIFLATTAPEQWLERDTRLLLTRNGPAQLEIGTAPTVRVMTNLRDDPRRRFSRSATRCNALSSRSPHAPSVTRGQRGLAAPSAAATDVVVLCCSAATSLLLHVAYKPFPGRLHSRGEYVLYECDASRRGMAEAQLKLAGGQDERSAGQEPPIWPLWK